MRRGCPPHGALPIARLLLDQKTPHQAYFYIRNTFSLSTHADLHLLPLHSSSVAPQPQNSTSTPSTTTIPQPGELSPQLLPLSPLPSPSPHPFTLKLTPNPHRLQNFVASICGATASLVVSAPLDVIKTRIQNRNFENPESGFKILGRMAREEGASSFFKGLTPKLLMTGPKLVFSFWLAQTLIPAFDKVL